MKGHSTLAHRLLPLLVLILSGTAQASTVGGKAVGAAGDNTNLDPTKEVGSTQSVTNIPDAIKYYIPLRDATNGIYGTGTVCSGSAAGTCSDSGSGSGYLAASALQMNIFFDLAGLPASQSASLSFLFDDLDLTDKNDPIGFFESISLSYWNWDTTNNAFDAAPVSVTGTITTAGVSPDPVIDSVDDNLITWDLDLLALGALNDSAQSINQGFWIQLGFGSKYVSYDNLGNEIPKSGTNTPEYLAAQLTVSPVPVPAAFWLFGTALIGFVGISRRTKIS